MTLMDNFKQQFQLYWIMIWLRRSIISAFTFTLFLVAIPFIIQFGITHLLIKQGATEASIEDINLNLFTGTFELKKLDITTGDYSPSQLQHLQANINMLDLVSSQIVLHEIQIDGLNVDLQLLENGSFALNGLTLLNSESSPDEPNVSDESDERESSTFEFGINKLSIINSKINYQESGFSHKNSINSLNLTNIKSWDATSIANLKVDAALNAAAFKLNVDLTLFNETRHFKGNASLGSLAFFHYQKFHGEFIDSLQGNIQLDSEFDISLSDIISANLDNNIQFEDLDINYQGIESRLKKLTINGKTQITNINFANFQQHKQSTLNDPQQNLLNLFTGIVELEQLALSSDKNQPAKIKQIKADVKSLNALSNRFVLNELFIDGIKTAILRTDDGQISINGISIPSNDTAAEESTDADDTNTNPVTFGVGKFSLVNSDIDYKETDFLQQNHINSIILTNIKSWDKASTTGLEVESILNNAPFKLSAELNLFNNVKSVKGKASLSSLEFTPYAKFYTEFLDHLEGNISLESEFEVSLADSISARLANTIQVAGLKLDYQDLSQSVDKISWKGNTLFSEKAELLVKGDLQIINNLTKDKKQDYLITSFENLSVKDLEKSLESISFKQLNIDKMQLVNIQQNDRFIDLNSIKVQDLMFQPDTSDLKIKLIGLASPQIKVSITKQKQLTQLLPLLTTIDNLLPPPEDDVEAQPNQEQPKPLNIEIAELTLLNPGYIDFSDLSVSPNYKTKIHLNRLDVNDISSQKNANFDIALKQGDYTTVDIKGDGQIFNPADHIHFAAQIKQLDLPPVTPYTSSTMGYGMKSGVIDSTIKVKLDNREIDSEVKLVIDSIEVVETSKDTAEQISSASGMSIDLAISTLKDKNNIIDLKLPIKGNIDKPDFDLKHIINKAMGKAMKSATFSYLKYALQPFGSFVTLFSLAKKAANHISLPPVLFKPNSLVFKADQQKLLDKVVKVLQDRPGLKIKACGISALEDQVEIKSILLKAEIVRLEAEALKKSTEKKAENKSANSEEKKAEEVEVDKIEIDPKLIHQKMRELADSRSAKVKAVFLEQGKLESGRILNCLSTTNIDKKSVAAVELSL